MEDEDKNSKSLVLITRVGSTPTTGIKAHQAFAQCRYVKRLKKNRLHQKDEVYFFLKQIRNRFYAPFAGYAKAPTEHGLCRGLAGNIFTAF